MICPDCRACRYKGDDDPPRISLNEVRPGSFGVNLIPHTQTATTLGGLKIKDKVNLEIDLLARYVARQLNKD